jgi:hypothetical protein
VGELVRAKAPPSISAGAPLEGQRTLERRAICGIAVRRQRHVDRQVEQRA